jgi:hypothetical protein
VSTLQRHIYGARIAGAHSGDNGRCRPKNEGCGAAGERQRFHEIPPGGRSIDALHGRRAYPGLWSDSLVVGAKTGGREVRSSAHAGERAGAEDGGAHWAANHHGPRRAAVVKPSARDGSPAGEPTPNGFDADGFGTDGFDADGFGTDGFGTDGFGTDFRAGAAAGSHLAARRGVDRQFTGFSTFALGQSYGGSVRGTALSRQRFD